jgi:hypothetical protein
VSEHRWRRADVALIRLVDALSRYESEFQKYFRWADLHEISVPFPWRTM